MTREEKKQLNAGMLNGKYDFGVFEGLMEKVFNDWRNKKIDGNKATKDIKEWYEKGLICIENKEDADNQRKKLKKAAPKSYEVMKRAINLEIVIYEQGKLNFICDKGCVGLIFHEAGFTGYKFINPYILINGKPPAKSTLQNGIKNPEPKSWEHLKEQLFSK